MHTMRHVISYVLGKQLFVFEILSVCVPSRHFSFVGQQVQCNILMRDKRYIRCLLFSPFFMNELCKISIVIIHGLVITHCVCFVMQATPDVFYPLF